MASPTRKKGAGIAFVLPERISQGATDSAQAAAAPMAEALHSHTAPAAASRPTTRTGVGLLTATMFESQRLEQEIAELNGQVDQLKAERGAQTMDPRTIAPSRWANRHADSFSGAEFQALKSEIQDAGGNVQPIKVRPIAGRRHDPEAPKYEIVFGHRRHRACLELGLAVLTIVEELDDSTLFVQMERENRERASLSAWEQGRMYLRAIEEGLFPSNTKLAAAIGRDASDVGKATRIAKLPQEVTSAFPSPNAIQFQWASDLEKALKEHRDEVLAAARSLSANVPRAGAVEAFRALTACLHDAGVGSSHPPRSMELGKGKVAVIKTDAKGRTTLQFPPGALPSTKWDAVEAALKRVLG